MRLRRLKLENWRGVDAREIEFGDGVTIVEGPNEAGKTSLIEALFTLVREYDTSTKQSIKAVKPVGRDVGSTVEADIEAGEYRFTYRKTFNKGKQTTLDIAAPEIRQLTGRDAHDRVEAILDETVDRALWEALLVDQGEKIAPADIKNSAGLSHALDEAAGTGSAGEEDTDLFDAVQAEYEKYFTLRTGKAKFDKLEQTYVEARTRVADANAALESIQADADRQSRLQADVGRRADELPRLEAGVRQHEVGKQAADRLRGDLELRTQQLQSARAELKNAEAARAERRELIEAIAADETALADAKEILDPMQARIVELDKRATNASDALEGRALARREQQRMLELAREDDAHLRNLAELGELEKLARDLDDISRELDAALDTIGGIAIDADGLQHLLRAEQALEVARARHDLGATTVRVSAETDLELDLDDESLVVTAGDTLERTAATDIELRLPGVASIRVSPPSESTSLARELDEAEAALAAALDRYQVESLEAGNEALARKQAAEQDVERLKARSADLLGDRRAEEVRQAVTTLRQRCDAYADNRQSETPLPADAGIAAERILATRQALEAAEQAYEAMRADENRLRKEREQLQTACGEARARSIGLDATLKEWRRRLDAAREQTADDDMDQQIDTARGQVGTLDAEVATLRRQLDELNPDRLAALYDNAVAAYERGRDELRRLETELAIVADRLEQSQASGRFEALEQAGRALDEAESGYTSTRRRATAAKRLWETLNRHRDAARQTYVAPLKAAIERLGKIVFGNDFEIRLSDDWAIETRTLGGKTLPYDELSVGAREQLGVLTRLAAAQIVSTQGGVPLIIDDALGFSDPDRLQTMGAAISAAGRECQVIILTCTPGRFAHVGSAAMVAL